MVDRTGRTAGKGRGIMAYAHSTEQARRLVSQMADYREYVQSIAEGKPKDADAERVIAALAEAEKAVTILTDAVEKKHMEMYPEESQK